MRSYGIFRAIPFSFFSKELYRDVATNWGGRSLLYLFVIISLSWIGSTYQIANRLNRFYANDSAMVVHQLPIVTVKNGELKSPENRPYLIKAPATGEIFAIIDTSGKYQDIDKTDAIILVTKTRIITKNKNEIKIYNYPSHWSKIIDPVAINEKISALLKFVWIPLFIVVVIGCFVLRVLQTLLYALIGKLISFLASVQLSYWQCMQISMVALTPALTVTTIIDLMDIHYNHIKLMSFVLTMIYIAFGIAANKAR